MNNVIDRLNKQLAGSGLVFTKTNTDWWDGERVLWHTPVGSRH